MSLPPSDHTIFSQLPFPFSLWGCWAVLAAAPPPLQAVSCGSETKIGVTECLESILYLKDIASSSALGLLKHLSSLALRQDHPKGLFPDVSLGLGADHKYVKLHWSSLPALLELFAVFLQLPQAVGSSGVKGITLKSLVPHL